MTKQKGEFDVGPLSDEELQGALLYFAQLALESRADPIGYEGTHELLRSIAHSLEVHRALRIDVRRKALIAETVGNILESEALEKIGVIPTAEHWERIAKWLRRIGVPCTPEVARGILGAPIRQGARDRTRKERLVEQLARVVGTSQSDLEKVVAVSERDATSAGRLGNAQLQERAASDIFPSRKEAFIFTCKAFGIDVESVVLSPADRATFAHAHDERLSNAATLKDGLRRKRGRSTVRK